MFKNFVIEFPSCSDVYALINGELTACKVLHVTADTESCKSFVCCESPDGFKNSFKVDELYASVTDYEKGKTVTAIHPKLGDLLPGCEECVKKDDEGIFFKKFYWVMVDGEPEKVYINAKRIHFDAKTRQATDIALPAEFYSSREECIRWNDINIVEADGTKRVQKSIRRSLMLTDEQKAIVEEISAAFAKAREAGIRIGYNSYDCAWYALNVTEVKDATFNYYGDVDEEYRIEDAWNNYRVNIPDPYFINDESCVEITPAE